MCLSYKTLAVILWFGTFTFKSPLRLHTWPRIKQQSFWIISVPLRPKFSYTLRRWGQGLKLDISLFCQIVFPEGLRLTLQLANFVQQEKDQWQDQHTGSTTRHHKERPLGGTFIFNSVSGKGDTLVILGRPSFWTDTCYVLPTGLQAFYGYLVLAGVCTQQQQVLLTMLGIQHRHFRAMRGIDGVPHQSHSVFSFADDPEILYCGICLPWHCLIQ